MNENMAFILVILILTVYCACGLKSVPEYERGIVFTTWKYTTILEPGLRFVWPIFQSMHRINLNKNVDEVSIELYNLGIPSDVITKLLDEARKLSNSNIQLNESVKKD